MSAYNSEGIRPFETPRSTIHLSDLAAAFGDMCVVEVVWDTLPDLLRSTTLRATPLHVSAARREQVARKRQWLLSAVLVEDARVL